MGKNKNHSDGMKIKGFFRVQLTEDGAGVVGDSGWQENQITNDGIRQYLVGWLVSGTGKSVTHMALGTGGAPASGATVLAGEVFHKSANATTNSRAAVSTSVVASGTAQFTAAFASANSFLTASAAIKNIGLFETYLTSLANAGTLFAGNTYASSTCARFCGTFISNNVKKFLKFRETLIETILSEISDLERRATTIIGFPTRLLI